MIHSKVVGRLHSLFISHLLILLKGLHCFHPSLLLERERYFFFELGDVIWCERGVLLVAKLLSRQRDLTLCSLLGILSD